MELFASLYLLLDVIKLIFTNSLYQDVGSANSWRYFKEQLLSGSGEGPVKGHFPTWSRNILRDGISSTTGQGQDVSVKSEGRDQVKLHYGRILTAAEVKGGPGRKTSVEAMLLISPFCAPPS